jgi:branched-chain amino acid transport system permease protein
MLGAYVAWATAQWTGSFWLGLLAAPLVLGAGSYLLKDGIRVLQQLPTTYQILTTIGVGLVIQELVIIQWDTIGKTQEVPEALAGFVAIGTLMYPKYRLFVVAVGALVALVLWLFLERTRLGAVLRAGTESEQMVSLLGIDMAKVFAWTFALGAALAAIAGALAAPVRGIEPFMSAEAIATAFVVVVIGGIGNFSGAFLAALLVGVVQSFVSTVWSEGAGMSGYVLMALIILLRPRGLMGRA